MSVGSWQPEPQSLKQLGIEQLHPLLDRLIEQPADQAADLIWVNEALNWVTPLAKADKTAWGLLAPELTSAQIRTLIRFFTLVEDQQNWDLSDKSPVIPLFKHLKKSEGLDRELVQWVKANTQNKFLPFGPLL